MKYNRIRIIRLVFERILINCVNHAVLQCALCKESLIGCFQKASVIQSQVSSYLYKRCFSFSLLSNFPTLIPVENLVKNVATLDGLVPRKVLGKKWQKRLL